VFKYAVRVLEESAREAVAKSGLSLADVDWLIPHQANIRILDATVRRLGIAPERLVVTVDRHGNTSAASVPLALDEAVRDGRIKAGHKVMLQGVGGGFTWGTTLVEM
jgi:3-oxoacyl-[acyl-carrier-protein] synthase-3